jgi:CheY-like chemotaxis protein
MREFYRHREPQLSLRPVDLNRLVTQVLSLTRVRWSDMPLQNGIVIQLHPDFAEDLPVILGMESELREALTNLVFNAVDAMPNGGILTLRTRTCESPNVLGKGSLPPIRCVQVEVIDTGIGMTDDTRRRCLEPFFTTKGERGTGLGLAMVYGTVQRHNAEIEIESAPDHGSTFRLLFPVPSNTPASPVIIPPTPVTTRLRLLIIDDDPLIIKSLCDALEFDGHSVVAVPFDLVITDLGMPYVDGRKVSAAIKGASPLTPIIMLTGWGERMAAEGDIPLHVDRVLSKPPKLREIHAAFVQLLASRHSDVPPPVVHNPPLTP